MWLLDIVIDVDVDVVGVVVVAGWFDARYRLLGRLEMSEFRPRIASHPAMLLCRVGRLRLGLEESMSCWFGGADANALNRPPGERIWGAALRLRIVEGARRRRRRFVLLTSSNGNKHTQTYYQQTLLFQDLH